MSKPKFYLRLEPRWPGMRIYIDREHYLIVEKDEYSPNQGMEARVIRSSGFAVFKNAQFSYVPKNQRNE